MPLAQDANLAADSLGWAAGVVPGLGAVGRSQPPQPLRWWAVNRRVGGLVGNQREVSY